MEKETRPSTLLSSLKPSYGLNCLRPFASLSLAPSFYISLSAYLFYLYLFMALCLLLLLFPSLCTSARLPTCFIMLLRESVIRVSSTLVRPFIELLRIAIVCRFYLPSSSSWLYNHRHRPCSHRWCRLLTRASSPTEPATTTATTNKVNNVWQLSRLNDPPEGCGRAASYSRDRVPSLSSYETSARVYCGAKKRVTSILDSAVP